MTAVNAKTHRLRAPKRSSTPGGGPYPVVLAAGRDWARPGKQTRVLFADQDATLTRSTLKTGAVQHLMGPLLERINPAARRWPAISVTLSRRTLGKLASNSCVTTISLPDSRSRQFSSHVHTC